MQNNSSKCSLLSNGLIQAEWYHQWKDHFFYLSPFFSLASSFPLLLNFFSFLLFKTHILCFNSQSTVRGCWYDRALEVVFNELLFIVSYS